MELTAEKRQKIGKSSKELMRAGFIPAVISGKGMESLPVTVKTIDYKKVYENAGETDLIDVNVGKESFKVLVRNTQFDPVSDAIVHAEFYKPNLKEKTEAEIPVEIINEETNPFVKSGEGVVIQLLNEVRVKALPMDLPHRFVVDALELIEVGAGITIAQLSYDKEKVEIVDSAENDFVVKLDKMVVEEEKPEVTEEEAVAAVEASKEKPETDEEETEEKSKKE